MKELYSFSGEKYRCKMSIQKRYHKTILFFDYYIISYKYRQLFSNFKLYLLIFSSIIFLFPNKIYHNDILFLFNYL